MYNPKYAETAIQIERVLQGLGARVTSASSSDEESKVQEVRSFIVHGHDLQSSYELKDYLQNTLGLAEPTNIVADARSWQDDYRKV